MVAVCNEKTGTMEISKIDCCSRMRYNPINNDIMAMLEAMEGTLYLPVTKVLPRRDCALSTKVLEVLEVGALCARVAGGPATYTGGHGKSCTL